MDGLKIRSNFARITIGKIIDRTIRKKIGMHTRTELDSFEIAECGDDKSYYRVELNGSICIKKTDISKLMAKEDLDED